MESEPRYRRPSTSHNGAIIDEVRRTIRRDRRLAVREVAQLEITTQVLLTPSLKPI